MVPRWGWRGRREFFSRVKTYTEAVRRREQGPFQGWKCSVLLEQTHVIGDEAEKKVGLGSWRVLGYRLKQLVGMWRLGEGYCPGSEKRRRRSLKVDSGEGAEETARRDSG